MVAASNYAFRCLCRQYGVDLTFTQMLHAKNVCHDPLFRHHHFDFYECSESTPTNLPQHSQSSSPPWARSLLDGLWESPASSHDIQSTLPPEWESYTHGPLIVQLAGHDVSQVVEAAQRVVSSTDRSIAGIDLNCGCPQGIARKGNYGAFLTEADNGQRVAHILTALRQALPSTIAVSAKIRLPLNPSDLPRRIRTLVGTTGIDFLTVHGRTLKENKTLVRAVQLDALRHAVQIAHDERGPGFPVVANGGMETYEDMVRIRQETKCVAVMSSEALLETPNVFEPPPSMDGGSMHPRRRFQQQVQFARDYLQWAALYPPLPGVLGHDSGSFNIVRGHLFKFLHRYWHEHTDLRDQLASHSSTRSLVDALQLLETLYQRYDTPQLRHEDNDDDAWNQLESSRPNASWYRRHWDVLQQPPQQQYPPPHAASRSSSSSRTTPVGLLSVSKEERKDLVRQRIAKLHELRHAKQAKRQQQQQQEA